MIDRRAFGFQLGAAATLFATQPLLAATFRKQLIRRPIPSSGEMLPVVGLGTSASFAQMARTDDWSALREVMKSMLDGGAIVLDTAPSYGNAEEVAGSIVKDLGASDKVFWATKVNVAGRGEGKADASAAIAQMEASFSRLHTRQIDLMQVHNLGDIPTQLAIVQRLKKEGRVRYSGVTTSSARQYPMLAEVMRNEPIDFIGVDYAVDNRRVEETILPLAVERKIGVLVYLPFGRTRLFQRAAGKALPGWSAELDARSWAQFFIKYVISHPAVTAVTPATTKASHMIDNLGGGMGKLPDQALRGRMARLIDALPAASA